MRPLLAVLTAALVGGVVGGALMIAALSALPELRWLLGGPPWFGLVVESGMTALVTLQFRRARRTRQIRPSKLFLLFLAGWLAGSVQTVLVDFWFRGSHSSPAHYGGGRHLALWLLGINLLVGCIVRYALAGMPDRVKSPSPSAAA